MAIDNNNLEDDDTTDEGGEQNFDFWSDEGARRFNEILDEGSAYRSTGVRLSEDPEADPDDEQRDYRDPELYDPDEETLPPGEMELIFENSFIQ
jgi:hypothetical protein